MRRRSLLPLTIVPFAAMACHGAERTTLERRTGAELHPPAMVANWDPVKRAFVPIPSASAAQPAGITPSASVASAAPVLQVLPSGKGTFIDLHGTLQSYVVMRALDDGGVTTDCVDREGAQ